MPSTVRQFFETLEEKAPVLPVWRGEFYLEGHRGVLTGNGRTVVDDWRRRAAAMLGRPVECDVAGAKHTGLAENIDDDGALIVTAPGGTLKIRSGEVRWL